jgi:hypothetical protein
MGRIYSVILFKEAQYAEFKKKKRIPLLMESGYVLSDWLAIMLCSALYADFTLKDKTFEQSITELVRQIDLLKKSEKTLIIGNTMITDNGFFSRYKKFLILAALFVLVAIVVAITVPLSIKSKCSNDESKSSTNKLIIVRLPQRSERLRRT